MLDNLRDAWDSFMAIPHIHMYLAIFWLLYFSGLCIWIILQKREPAATLSWLFGLALLPYIGIVVYQIFGPQKISRHRLRRSKLSIAPLAAYERKTDDEDAIEIAKLSHAVTHLPLSTARDVRLLVDGAATFASIIEDIKHAKQQIHLEYYIYTPDVTGETLREALIERAKAGVKIRLLVDAIGSSKVKRNFFDSLVDAGAELALFHPSKFGKIWTRTWVNMRSHRKIVIIDGTIAYTGGINITDDENEEVNSEAYRDLHVRMEGDVARVMQQVFIEDWVYATNKRDVLSETAVLEITAKPGKIHTQILTSGPDSLWEAIHRLHVSLIHTAKKRVWLITPYFVPGEAAMMALTSAAFAGLDVRVIIPKNSDNRLVTLAARSYFDLLLAAGVKVYEYGPRMLHTKALLVDDEYAMIGTANFDQRSFRLNFEVSALFHDPDIAKELEKVVEIDMASAPRVKEERDRPLFTVRLPEAVARLLSPLL